MVTLQQHFSSMEETVRTLLQNQDSLDGPKVDPLDLMKAYKDKLLEEMWKQQDSLEAPSSSSSSSAEASRGSVEHSQEHSQDSDPLMERLRALEAENSALSMENDNQRKQYERCLDEVANQVVQALLTQKDLKEECVKLRTRVFDLEQQNRILSVLFQQRVKMSTAPVSQEVQRNGKAGIPAGRWPSLLSLTCPRSSGSGSGSELSLSSAGSEYSSGSHTWAEGRGFSKQCAASRDKRMSTGSVSSNHSTPVEPAELGWKEGHILKGLKRLQTSGSKEASSNASVPHCKDCMTSNEGIYSLGVKCGLQGGGAKQAAPPTSKPFKTEEGVSAMDFCDDDDSPKTQSVESSERPTLELLCVEKPDVSKDDDGNLLEEPVKLTGSSGFFPSPVTDNFLFLEAPSVKPGVSPTQSLTRRGETSKKDSLEKPKASGLKFSDRNNNQERSTDRKSRLDQVQGPTGRPATVGYLSSSVPHTATRALSCVKEARQRSSSVEVTRCGENHHDSATSSDSPQRKLKPQTCDSARRAFILRSKSADGGPAEQGPQTHSPLHQKLIKGPRVKGQSSRAKRTNLGKTHGSRSEKDEEATVVSVSSKSLESVQLCSPLASPVKYPKTSKPPLVNETSESPIKKLSLPIARPPISSDSTEESAHDNLPCSPRKQRRHDQHYDASDHRTPPPAPPPPGRTTSLLLRPSSVSEAPETQSSTMGKIPSNNPKTQSYNHLCNALQPQPGAQHKDPQQHTGQQMEIPAKLRHLSMDRTGPPCLREGFAPSILPSQSVLQRSQQSISEPKLSEVLPQVYSNVYYHGAGSNHFHGGGGSTTSTRAVKLALPLNARSNEAIAGPETNAFLVFGRQNRDDVKSVQTFQTFACDPRECCAHDKVRRKIEARCNSLDSEPPGQPVASDSGVMLDWGFDEEGWLFKRSVSVSTRPLLKPVMGMNGAKARSQSFGARYMDRPSFNRSGKVRTQIKTHSGTSLNSLGDVLPGSMSCSSSYHCPMNRSLLNNFLIEEGLAGPTYLGSSSERLQSLKLQREQARRIQIEQQFSSAFGEPVSEEPERQSSITTIEEKVMLGIEENLHKCQEQERGVETVKQKSSGSSLANWFGFRKSKLPAPSGKKVEPPKVKEEKREQKITSLLGGKNAKSEKKRDRRKSDGKESSVGRRESHDAVRSCISMPCPGMSLNESQGHADLTAEPKMQMRSRRADSDNGSTRKNQEAVIGCKMRTLDSGIGTIPLPESCSFFSSILQLLPRTSSTPEPSLSPPSAPGSSSEEVSPSPLPRWRIPSSLPDSHIHSVPFPTVAFLQPARPQCDPRVTCASVCESQSRLPRPVQGGMEPKKLTYIKSKPRASPSQRKETTRLQLANCKITADSLKWD